MKNNNMQFNFNILQVIVNIIMIEQKRVFIVEREPKIQHLVVNNIRIAL